jgi:hypothetical protein
MSHGCQQDLVFTHFNWLTEELLASEDGLCFMQCKKNSSVTEPLPSREQKFGILISL